MTATGDELAGVVDLFGALTRGELSQALTELAFKQRATVDNAAVTDAIETAVNEYVLVRYAPESNDEGDSEGLLTVGPTAFPSLPPNAEDLPHILDYERRAVDRDQLAEQVRVRLETEADEAIAADNADRAATLLDVSYDLEAWAAVETDGIRASLSAALPQD